MIRTLLFLFTGFISLGGHAQSRSVKGPQMEAYLFTYFTGNARDGEAIRFAVSTDGFKFRALNQNRPVLSSAVISSTGGVRDPHILRRQDGKGFLMVATDMVSALGWNSNRAMVLLKSPDLVHWTSRVVNIQKRFPGQDSLLRVWAPQTIYDARVGKYMLYWSMKHGVNAPDKIYYAYANEDFTDLSTEPQQLFFPPDGGACIDGDIIEKDGRFHLFFKTEGRGKGIKVAVSDRLTGGYVQRDPYVQQTKAPVEGAGVYRLNGSDEYVLMYDVYTSGKYQFCRTMDLEHFRVADDEVSMDFHPRHGTVMPLTKKELKRLLKAWDLSK
jgi:sucrose-6-phosphate hydrolase SacC (GH32 family)